MPHGHNSLQLCTVLYCTLLYCTVLYCTVLYCTVLYCTVLYCTVLYRTVLYCTVLYCTVIHYIITLTIFVEGNGTFAIGGIFDLKNAMKEINPQIGIHFVEAFRFAIHQINKNSSLLYGFKFSEEITKDQLLYETGDGSNLVNTILFQFFASNKPKGAAIAPYGSYNSYKLSIVTDGLKYPVMSYSASFDTTKDQNSFFFRTVPEDSFRVMAMVDLVIKLEWNFVSIISSNDRDGDNAARNFIKKISKLRICYYSYISLQESATVDDYVSAINEASANVDAKGLVLFTKIGDSLGLIKALVTLNQTRRFQILAASGFTNYIEITKGNENVLEGSLSLEHSTKEVTMFREYFLSLNASSNAYPEFKEFWEQTFQCSVEKKNGTKQCTGNEKLQPGQGYYENTPVHLMINLAYALAYLFRFIVETGCKKKLGYCSFDTSSISPFLQQLRSFLQGNSFPDCTLNLTDPITNFDPYSVEYDVLNYVRNGTGFLNRKVGLWTFRRLGWDKPGRYYLDKSYNGTIVFDLQNVTWKGNSSVLTSSCRKPCAVGYVKKQSNDFRLEKCCWSCVKCMDNQITENDACKACERGSKPNVARTRCTKLRTEYFRSSRTGSLSLNIYMAVAASGILCTIFVIALFIKSNNNRIVRASGRELCYFMLVGIIMTFLVPFTFYFEPSPIVCSLQIVLPGLALCICYSPLFLKTNRIYRIFLNAQTSISRPQFISPKSQLLLLLFIICIQILLGVIWIVSSRPEVIKFYPPGEYVILHCGEDGTKMVLNLMFSVVFMICCTWYAFKTRNFPKNYNESKYIGFTMYITCICWAVFMPMYFISKADSTYMRVHLLCVIMVCIGFLTLFGLFGQKVRLILFPRLVGENAAQPGQSQASRIAADPNKYQVQIHKIDALSICKEPSFIRPSSVIVNSHATSP